MPQVIEHLLLLNGGRAQVIEHHIIPAIFHFIAGFNTLITSCKINTFIYQPMNDETQVTVLYNSLWGIMFYFVEKLFIKNFT